MPATMIVASDTKELPTLLINRNKHKKTGHFLIYDEQICILVIQNLAEGFLKTMKMCGWSPKPILGSF